MPTLATPISPIMVANSSSSKHTCPVCNRPLTKKDTWRGIIYAVAFFPCGIYFCLRRRNLRCKACKFEVLFSDQRVPSSAEAFKCYRELRWQLFKPLTAAATNCVSPVGNGPSQSQVELNSSINYGRRPSTDDLDSSLVIVFDQQTGRMTQGGSPV